MNIFVYYLIGLAVVLTITTIAVIMNEEKEEKQRKLEIAKGPQGRAGHNQRGDFFYDRF